MAIYDKSTSFSVDTPSWSATGKEPKASLKRTGFTAGFKPPAAYFNWFWNRVCRNLAEIKNKIRDIWSFVNATDFLIYEEVEGGVFSDGIGIRNLYTRDGHYVNKKNYILTGVAGEGLAEEIGVNVGTPVQVSNRYPDYYDVYVPQQGRLYTYFRIIQNQYGWNPHNVSNIAYGVITVDHLSDELREQLGI
jgi:hypothetical protein